VLILGENILFIIIAWFCGAIFIGIGIYSICKKTPIHFWAGTSVKSDEIKDIRAYNKANGIMWISYGSTFVLAGVFSLLNMAIGTMFFIIAGIAGTFVLILVYNHIYNKYKA